MFANCYKGRRVLVTGHTGFKGSWLITWLLKLGAEVAGYSVGIPTSPSLFESAELDRKIHDFRGDVRDRKRLTAVMQTFQPEIVFHLAAQALVRASYADPAGTIETNAIGTLNVLEAVRATSSVRALVCITSDKAYRNVEWVWGYRETDTLGGDDPYSASKGCAEIIAHSYFASFFHDDSAARCATSRAGNVIGGGDWAADRIVPDCARAWNAKRAVEIRSPLATRPWQHVLEPLSGYLWLGSRLFAEANGQECAFRYAGESFNFGPSSDSSHTVAQVVESLAAQWPGFESKMDALGQRGMKECTLLKLCCDKALAWLDWRAVLDFDTTMRFTAQWYERFYAGGSAGAYDITSLQIDEYCDFAAKRQLAWMR